MKIAILGAGPAGLALANQLTKNNCEVDIYDNAQEAGGFSKSIELYNRKIEIGPHFLNIGKLPAVKKLVLNALNGNHRTYKRETFILIDKKIFLYPPSAGDILKKLSFTQLIIAAAGLLKQYLIPQKLDGSAETFVIKNFGLFLYKYFFLNFSRKLWGLDGRQVSDVFAKSLIGFNQGFSPIQVIYNNLKKRLSPAKDGDLYLYPNNGFSTLWNALKEQIESQGGNFHFSTQIKSLSVSSQTDQITHLTLTNGSIKEYDLFISTIPILPLLSLLPLDFNYKAQPEKNIKYRSDILLYLKVKYDSVKSGHCFYLYSNEFTATRITNFDAFNPGDGDFAILLLEFWCGKADKVWQMESEDLLNTAFTELNQAGIFSNLKILESTVKKIENAFQVPDLAFPDNKDQLFSHLSAFENLYVTGRNAAINFNYGMENAMDDGIKLADELLKFTHNKYQLEKI